MCQLSSSNGSNGKAGTGLGSPFTQRETEVQSLISAAWLADPVKVYGETMVSKRKLCLY